MDSGGQRRCKSDGMSDGEERRGGQRGRVRQVGVGGGGGVGGGRRCSWATGLEGAGASEGETSGTPGNSACFPTARKWGREAAESPSGNFGRMFQMFWGGEQSPWDVEAAVGASWALGWGGGGDASWRTSVCVCTCMCVFINLVAGDWCGPSPYPCELSSRHRFGTLVSAYCVPEPESVLSTLHGSFASFHLLHPLWRKGWHALTWQGN